MKNLFQLLYRFHVFIFFVGLQILCLFLLVSHNRFQHSAFVNSANGLVGSLFERRAEFSEYFHLSQINNDLALEVARLSNMDREAFIRLNDDLAMIDDTLHLQVYRYTTAKVINNSVNRQSNYVTLNKGKNHGIDVGMGVISQGKMLGIVKDVSEHYSVVMPIINSRFEAGVKLKKSQEFGLVYWPGEDSFTATVKDIPTHSQLAVGDSIVSTGYSHYFPEGLLVGTVKSFEIIDGQNDYEIEIDLALDFHRLNYVWVVANLTKDEIEELEQNAMSND